MNIHAHKRQQILQQMEQIDCMEQGSLQSETRPSARDSHPQQGPYFKHQIWEQGRNVSRRIPAEKAPALAKAIKGRKEFETLAGQFVEATVAMTRAGTSADSKKNGTKSRRRSKGKRPATSSNS
jgi:hypothetical protein